MFSVLCFAFPPPLQQPTNFFAFAVGGVIPDNRASSSSYWTIHRPTNLEYNQVNQPWLLFRLFSYAAMVCALPMPSYGMHVDAEWDSIFAAPSWHFYAFHFFFCSQWKDRVSEWMNGNGFVVQSNVIKRRKTPKLLFVSLVEEEYRWVGNNGHTTTYCPLS